MPKNRQLPASIVLLPVRYTLHQTSGGGHFVLEKIHENIADMPFYIQNLALFVTCCACSGVIMRYVFYIQPY